MELRGSTEPVELPSLDQGATRQVCGCGTSGNGDSGRIGMQSAAGRNDRTVALECRAQQYGTPRCLGRPCMLRRKQVPPKLQELLPVLPEDIGDVRLG